MTEISVLMPVYNGKVYLEQSVESILSQTFSSFEFIIIDDCSTDSTYDILLAYAALDSRIKLHKNESNFGIEKTLNIGLAIAQGKYVARQDADDISFENRLEKQFSFLEHTPAVGAIGAAVEIIDSQGQKVGESHPPTDHESLKMLFLINNFMHHSTLMARRDLLMHIGGYNEQMRRAEDYDLWWRLSCHSRVENLPEVLLKRRLDDGPRISVLHRESQLICSYKIALGAVVDTIGNRSYFPKKSYERLWWAILGTLDRNSFLNYWSIPQGKAGELSFNDIKQLYPLWNFIYISPGGRLAWGTLLQPLILDFINLKKFVCAFQILYITQFNWKIKVRYFLILKVLVRALLPSCILSLSIPLRQKTFSTKSDF
ncbi:glycosyltransferase [Nodosilinea sp. LEGE 06152]|uniref:glycosyltransferase n=1 Tax=Nodosilinea sp. LEGE 06152 TaxID=2777966 RepID=UPI00187E5918|nr:glycosyltransferase [Nodosilinea sp. LEGE 06152]MBE9158416.1 glycosyltransferase [Nodosilinea sp. LEGE 06152]